MQMTSIAREIKGDSLILGVDQFQSRCSSIQLKRFPYNFMAGIYNSDGDLRTAVSDFEISDNTPSGEVNDSTQFLTGAINGTAQSFFCKYLRVGGRTFSQKTQSYVLRYYPVAIQQAFDIMGSTQYIIIPGVMAMVVWE